MKINILRFNILTSVLATALMLSYGCSSGKKEKEETTKNTDSEVSGEAVIGEHGVGPVEHVNLPAEVDQTLAEKGKIIFEGKCTACHKFDERYVGPALAEVTERRNPAWIMNMIMNPQEMTGKDPVAKKLLAEYMTQMVNQNVTEEDARALLEYFRSVDKN